MSKYTYFPRNAHLTQFQNKLLKTFWISDEITYEGDRVEMQYLENIISTGKEEQIGKLTITAEQAKNIILFVKNILCLFAQLDGVVIENLIENFTHEISLGEKEIQQFYITQALNELVHSETYSTQVERLIENPKEKEDIYTASLQYPAVHEITDWTLRWFDTSLPLVERLIAFICVEGVIFTSGFVAIYRLKEWGLFSKGLCKANEWIARDEAVHTAAGIEFFKYKVGKHFQRPTDKRVFEIIDSAVTLACQFADEAIKPELIGLDSEDMKKYIKMAADRVLQDLEYPKIYHIPENPFEWMEKINMFNISNMFESRVSEYAVGDAKNQDDGWD
jgi:ribonucleotide reductase beta subunit family protein with ferritin-like domain